MKSSWFVEVVPHDRYPYTPALDWGDDELLRLPISFDNEEEAWEFLREHVVGAVVEVDAQAAMRNVEHDEGQ